MNSIRNLEALMKISLSESERKLITLSNVQLWVKNLEGWASRMVGKKLEQLAKNFGIY
jgi:hypothetical protein